MDSFSRIEIIFQQAKIIYRNYRIIIAILYKDQYETYIEV